MIDKRDIAVYIAMHKPYEFVEVDGYHPIQVNAQNNKVFLPLTDADGDNISLKNDRFCELTALYWIWKNDKRHKYIGLCHYRRYFKMEQDFCNYFESVFEKEKLALSDIAVSEQVLHALEKGKVIVPKKYKFGGKIHHESVEQQYVSCHNEEDLVILKKVLLAKYPDYEAAWSKVFHRNWIYAYNMFIMGRTLFHRYMEWLFDVLFEVEKRIPPKDDLYQNRSFGFMSERLFNVFLEHNDCQMKELPIIFLT
ncbi:DUF4422 domain-containing protein [Megasphaera sp. DISK 18]|uniref:DUF4422 domain-containing protein n=1 Tax=Megasphaera sp. DISK 18 TaxID=1776081 RepID=UPI0008071A03|nr:DUF4422 domain-containing protein [Megasphaera sp. DISK 18]OBZ33317.1 hypothetical protein A0U42_07405 [Megasphaera sp. DISK 18]